MQRENVSPGEYLHIYNRGVLKQPIFFNDIDKKRFLFLILFLQYSDTIKNIDREFKNFVKNTKRYLVSNKPSPKNRYVELVSFCLMPNHFHFLVHELQEGGVSKYMQRIQNAYTKYINTKYNKSGHLLQGPYKAVRLENNEQLLYLSCYIHKNPNHWRNYFYSSYQDCDNNRWGDLLNTKIITSQFTDKYKDTYKNFIETSTAKELMVF